MLTGYQVLFFLALIWEIIYTISYGWAAFRNGKRVGGAAVALLAVLPMAVFVFLTFFQGE